MLAMPFWDLPVPDLLQELQTTSKGPGFLLAMDQNQHREK
jgi:hypothetical protein